MVKIGLAIEGGGLRGICAVGVLDTLVHYPLEVGGIVGAYVGVVHAWWEASKSYPRWKIR